MIRAAAKFAFQYLPSPWKRAVRRALAPGRDKDVIQAIAPLRAGARLESPPCAICGGSKPRLHLVKNGFRIVRCPADRLIFVSPRPTILSPYYESGYYSGGVRGVYESYEDHAAWMSADWTARLATLESYLGKQGDLLDVGAATGRFLVLARDRGWRVRGIDLSKWAAEQARVAHGLDVLDGSLPHPSIRDQSVDVVTMWDCIEHLTDPRGVLDAIRRVLRPGGLLGLSTGALPDGDPDATSGWYYPPWHLYYFSRETITALLRETGFEVLDYSLQDEGSPYEIMRVVARPRPGIDH